VRPEDADVGLARRPETDVDPAELPPGVTAPDRQLPPHRRVADLDLEPAADRVAVRAGLGDAERQPVPHRRGFGGIPAADAPPDLRRRAEVDLDEVEQTVEIEVGQRRPAAAIEAEDAGRLRALLERP